MDRYELRERLAEGSAGVLYAALDTVAGSAVSLLLLPAPLAAAPGALDQLRGELASVARFRHPGVAHLLHLTQLWELDPAARAETGAEPGAAALVADLPTGPTLCAWRQQFPQGRIPVDKALDVIWELAEALDALHGADLAHGALHAGTVRMTLRGPVMLGAALDAYVHQAMARLGLGAVDSGDESGEMHGDLLALAQVAEELLPASSDAPWLGILAGVQDSSVPHVSARQFAGALRESAEAEIGTMVASAPDERAADVLSPATPGPEPMAAPAAAVPDSEGSLAGAASQEGASAPVLFAPPARSPRASRVLNIALVFAALAVVALIVFVVLSQRRPPVQPRNELPWEPLKQDKRPTPTFAWRATLPAMAPGQQLRFRAYGQTRVLAMVLTADRLTIQEKTGRDETRELVGKDVSSWSAGDVLAVVKGPDSLAAYRNGECLVIAPCPLERWRLVRWDQVGGLVPTGLSSQKIGRLVFADDFMHGENEFGPWKPESGEWTMHALQNPIRSANPFSFLGKGSNAAASAGHWFWRNYRLTCSAHPLAGSAFGMSFCRQDAENTYDLRWRSVEGVATLELSRVAAGQRQALASRALPFQASSWVSLAASQLDGLLVVAVDGHEVFRVADKAPLLGGGVALWTDGGQGTVFDDVTVGPVDDLAVTPATGGLLPTSLLPSGELASGELASTEAAPQCLLGGVLLENATVTVTGDLGSRSAPVTLFARQSGPKAVRLRLVPGSPWQAEIVAVGPAGESVLTKEEIAPPQSTGTLALTVLHREAWGTLDGRVIAHASRVPVLGRGHGGVEAPADAPFAPTQLAVSPAVALGNIDNRVETFTHEQSMQNWNSPVLAWTPDYTSSVPLYWHRSDFWRDVSASADMAGLSKLDEVQTWGIALAEEGIEDGSAARRWELYLTPNTQPSKARDLYLRAPGCEPESLPSKGTVKSLSLVRRGNRLLAKRNGRVIWHGRLPEDTDGLMRVGRIGRGATNEWAQSVEIRAESLRTYAFKDAPVDWQPVSGEWKVTSRWECDPRWSFFSGVQRQSPACLWSKRQHGDNITVEFFVGPKMDRSRGKWYEYAADFNAVICADGKDISSGYSFMFGGWNDRGSQIVRGREIVAENRRIVIPRKSSTHRRWFHVKLRKRGKQLTFWVDGARVGSVRDEKPLTGNRFGLWTWDNGIMVAQVRVATDGQMASVGMDSPPNPRPKTPYDK